MKFVCCLAVALATAASAQAQPSPRIVGTRTTTNWKMDSTRTITESTTLVFQSADGGSVYTIDFITRHPLKQPVPAPGVVDMVVTQLPVEDETPEMTLRVD